MKFLNIQSIGAKISSGYAAIILITVVISVVTFFTVQKLRGIDQEISGSVLPTYIALKEFSSLNNISYKLSSNWIYQPNQQDKQALGELVKKQWPELKKKIIESNGENETVKLLVLKFEKTTEAAGLIMSKLNADSLYSNDVVIDECITILDKTIQPEYTSLNENLNDAIKNQTANLNQSTENKNASYDVLTYLVIFSIVIYALIGITASRISTKIIVDPINKLKDLIISLSKGEIADVKVKKSNDEIGEMVDSIKVMINGLKSNRDFAVEIGKGNYGSDFTPLSGNDQMGNALLNMRSNLKANSEEAEKRNWATAGQAKIGEILRKTDQGAEVLYDNTIQFIVKYLKGNQGALFIINDEDKEDRYLTLAACYAYDRKKYLNMRVNAGEGLVGQCFLEKEMIYMTNVPQNFVKITSGLGDALPSCILIVPIKLNEEVHGVIELAFFKKLEKHEIEFVVKIAESIAATITTVKVAERTKQMVTHLQEQGEEMRAQEEEMRQNMEELSATQEEMGRKEKEYLSKIDYLEKTVLKLEGSHAVLSVEATKTPRLAEER